MNNTYFQMILAYSDLINILYQLDKYIFCGIILTCFISFQWLDITSLYTNYSIHLPKFFKFSFQPQAEKEGQLLPN